MSRSSNLGPFDQAVAPLCRTLLTLHRRFTLNSISEDFISAICPSVIFQFLSQPRTTHFQAVKRVFRYLKGTYNLGLHIKPFSNPQLIAYTDAGWACDLDDRKSMGGMCVFLGNNLVSWSSRKQKVVSRSSTESEYRSLSDGSAEIKWLCSLLAEIGLSVKIPSVIWCDNLSATYIATNPVFHARTKHIELDYHFIRDCIAKKCLNVCYVPSKDQIADLFTKGLS